MFLDHLYRIFCYVTFHQISQKLRKFVFRFIAIFLRFEESRHVILKLFGSNLLLRNFSPYCTNIKKVCLSIHSNLFKLWGVQVTCLLDCLDQILYDVTFHPIVKILRKFVFDSWQSYYALRSPDNVVLSLFTSKVLLYKFSPNCTNITKVCFRCRQSFNLFRLWGIQITCFWDLLVRIFYCVTVHQSVIKLRKFDFRFIAIFLRFEEYK